jgi:hypothetical protein
MPAKVDIILNVYSLYITPAPVLQAAPQNVFSARLIQMRINEGAGQAIQTCGQPAEHNAVNA